MRIASKRLLLNLSWILDIRSYKSSFIVIVNHLGFSCHCSSGHKSAIALWYSYIVATRYRTTHWDIEMKGEQKWATNEMKWDRKKEKSDRRTKGIRRSEGGLSVLFARRAVIEYRYSQSRGACRRADAKINEPITEVESRLLCLCVWHASAHTCALLVSPESTKGSFKTDERGTVIRKNWKKFFLFV